MFAIIETGGHQFRVEKGSTIAVDRLDKNAGDEITFDRVLFIQPEEGQFSAGAPYLDGARVTGIIDAQTLGKKLRVFRKRRRQGFRRTLGHRKSLTEIRITDIHF